MFEISGSMLYVLNKYLHSHGNKIILGNETARFWIVVTAVLVN